MRPLAAWLLCVAAATLAGRWAGPFLARAHPTVRLAAIVAAEERTAGCGDEARTTAASLEMDAFRDAGRRAEDLYEEARAVERRFRLGGALLGAFYAIAVALMWSAQARTPREPFYHVDREACVSCGRCFAYCPRERLRRGLIGADEAEALRHG